MTLMTMSWTIFFLNPFREATRQHRHPNKMAVDRSSEGVMTIYYKVVSPLVPISSQSSADRRLGPSN
jgi:hypothetical protein